MNKIVKMNFIIITACFIFFLPLQASANGKVSDGSGVANITLEGLDFEEAKSVLVESITTWQQKEPIQAESDFETVDIPREVFEFDVDATLNELDEKTKREWSNFFMKRKNVQIPLHVTVKANASEEVHFQESVDVQATLAKAELLASNLMEGTITIEYETEATFETEEIAAVSLELPEASLATITRLAEELNGQIISSEEVFSFLQEVVLPAGLANSELEMSFVASALYELVLHTELEVMERHKAEAVPTFTDAGLEAIVDRHNEKNLLIYNPAITGYGIEAVVVGNELVTSIHTTAVENKYTFSLENEKEIEQRTIYRYSEELTGPQEVVVEEGSPGLQLEVWKKTTTVSGEEISGELIARDYYPPTPKIVHIARPLDRQPVIVEQEDNEVPDIPNVTEEPNTTIPNPIENANSFEDRLNQIAKCNGNPACEETLQVTEFDKLFMNCLNELFVPPAGEEAVEETEANDFCDFVYLLFFLSFMNEDPLPNQENTNGENKVDESVNTDDVNLDGLDLDNLNLEELEVDERLNLGLLMEFIDRLKNQK